ncbi:hypothetical protein [Lichenihabitans psoromatis]|uniref:hypothetical protein n=1 Tax=Lichenihabitans psoromatis TaxID=2528642 RepID=UPI00103669F8|nr:hypothetical protein [Lichenihabitans psoromatis]
MRVLWAVGLCLAAGLVNAGCSMTGGGNSISAATPPVPAAPPPIMYGTFLDGPVGSKLSQADRDKALASEQDALASGQRKTWKGEHGLFGFVEPAPGTPASAIVNVSAPGGAAPATADSCRAFTSTIFIAGRPQVGHGTGCSNPDGTYRITS